MFQIFHGDLFQSKAQTLVNAVNCVGVMGKGIALEFKKRYPDMFRDYQERCRAGAVSLGYPYLYNRSARWVLNFPTKNHWKDDSRFSDLLSGLKYLVAHYKEWGITSLAVPALGCGNGGLPWRDVAVEIENHLGGLDIPVELYAPVEKSGIPSRSPSPAKPSLPELAENPNPVAMALLLRSVENVYHMTHALNVESILRHGLHSYNRIHEQNVLHVDISNPDVQKRRDGKRVFGVTDLHDFVPFYFAWFTQMQRNVEGRGVKSRDSLVFLEIEVLRLAILRRSILFTADNAAKDRVGFSNDPRQLDSINWTAVEHAKSLTKPPFWSAAPSAELLVSSHVPVHAIRRIICRTQPVASRLVDMAANIPFTPIPVEVEPGRYFPESICNNARLPQTPH